MNKKMIGVVGGMGSYAGIDLIKKVYDLTDAKTDQEHLPVTMISEPQKVPDRTQFLLGNVEENPAHAIANIINSLVAVGCSVVGIPCNTAHAEPIHKVIRANIDSSCVLINMIDEVGKYLTSNHPEIKIVGLLATNGTIASNVYVDTLKEYDIEIISPTDEIQDGLVHQSIFDQSYGIKTFSNPVNPKSRGNLLDAANYLISSGAEAIILGCTEIPLAIHEKVIDEKVVIDPTLILAQALIDASVEKQ